MARLLTFSRVFPAYHPKAGEQTYFVEKIWNSQNIHALGEEFVYPGEDYLHDINPDWKHLHPYKLEDFVYSLARKGMTNKKLHTIRAGKRWKVGDKFSPRVWSGKPYRSKMITILPDLEVKKIFDIEIKLVENGYDVIVDGKSIDDDTYNRIASNDGLTPNQLRCWFGSSFIGQIICWDDRIDY